MKREDLQAKGLTDEQIDFVNYYWGLTDKRSPEELYRILRSRLYHYKN